MKCPCRRKALIEKYGSSHEMCCAKDEISTTKEDVIYAGKKAAKEAVNTARDIFNKVTSSSSGGGNNKEFGGQVLSGKKLRNLNGGSRRAL